MPADCLFCKIAQGVIPAHRVYEDEAAFAFLDIRPLARGHTLVVPKAHAERFEDLTEETASRVWRAVRRIVPALAKASGTTSTTLAINNGKEAGQEVPHVHVHIVPRTAGDAAGPIHALFHQRPTVTPEELGALATTVRKAIGPAPQRTP